MLVEIQIPIWKVIPWQEDASQKVAGLNPGRRGQNKISTDMIYSNWFFFIWLEGVSAKSETLKRFFDPRDSNFFFKPIFQLG